MTKRILSLLLVLLLALSMAACTTPPANNGEQPASVPSADGDTIFTRVKAGEPVQIEIFPNSGYNIDSGLLDTPLGDWVLEKYNIKMYIWAYSGERETTILSSGDYPDMMHVSKADNLENAIHSGNALCLDEYLDEMPHIRDNDAMQLALEYVRQYRSADTGKVYCFPTAVQVNHEGSTEHVSRYRPFIYWDYFYGLYKDSGAPELNNLDDLTKLMKDCMAAYPTTKDGSKVWGMALSYGYKTTYEYAMMNAYWLIGYTDTSLQYMVETNGVDGTYKSILDSDSKYKELLKWYNNCYLEGVLDPDSINYANNDVYNTQKNMDQGYYVLALPASNMTDVDHWQTLYTNFTYSYYSVYKPYGNTSGWWVIDADTQILDAVLVLCDSFANVDDVVCYKDGPQGEHWDVDENGTPYFTQCHIDYLTTGAVETWSDGSEYTQFAVSRIMDTFNYTSLGDGQTYVCNIDKWPLASEISRSERDEQWTEMYGYRWTVDMLKDKGQLLSESPVDLVTNFCGICSDEMQLVADSCADAIIENTWKMIYAKDDAEFESFWNEMVQKCNDLGAAEVIEWRMNDLKEATAKRDALSASAGA